MAAGTAVAAPLGRPSERGCLLAWNASANDANRTRLLAAHPTGGLSLRAGVSGTDTWKKGVASKHTSAEVCLLTISRRGGMELVTGIWHDGRVGSWSWGRTFATQWTLPANVRLLADGRVTKIYRR